jgi:D-alanine-D-alanine ligase
MLLPIAVLTGGSAAEVGISLKSAGVIMKHLPREQYVPYMIVIDGNDWRHEDTGTLIDKNDFTLCLSGQKIYFAAVFIAIHGTPAEDGLLQGYFDMLRIPYSCCGVLSAALTFDKQRCKTFLSSLGIVTAKGFLLHRGEKSIDNSRFRGFLSAVQFPVFVKPNKNGSSYGAAKVDSYEGLEQAIENAFQYDNEILVEEYLQGTEVTCGLFQAGEELIAFPITEIRSATGFFDYAAKYEGKSLEITPAEISPGLTSLVQETSRRIYRDLGFKGMCRIDYILVGDQPYMLEVNAIPGLSEESIVPQQARAYGWSLPELFHRTLQDAIQFSPI